SRGALPRLGLRALAAVGLRLVALAAEAREAAAEAVGEATTEATADLAADLAARHAPEHAADEAGVGAGLVRRRERVGDPQRGDLAAAHGLVEAVGAGHVAQVLAEVELGGAAGHEPELLELGERT